jgi:capsular exopolysaccharide synthesis family protein
VKTLALKKSNHKNVSKRRNLITSADPKSPISEQFRTIRTNIEYGSVDQELKTIMVTSSGPMEGKSTTLANLGVVFAQQGKKVLIVDADLRRPTVHYTFNINNILGFTSVLMKQTTFQKAVEETEVENLFVLTSGPIPPNPAELLSSIAMKRFIEEAKKEFDVVLFDTPPLLAVADPQIIANQCDASILVVFSGKTEIEQAQKTVELLENSQGKFLGAVLNYQKSKQGSYYYYYGSE